MIKKEDVTKDNVREYIEQCNIKGMQIELAGVNLEGANLKYTNFTDTYLTNANFTDAKLEYANFKYANFIKDDFNGDCCKYEELKELESKLNKIKEILN